MKLSLGSDKRLKSKKKIERLFLDGKKHHKFPIRAVYFFEEEESNAFQITVSVPKKLIKKAVDRNRIKRRMREAFRLNQMKLKNNRKLEVMFIYTTSELKDYATIEKSILDLIDFLNSLSDDNISEK